MNRSTIDNTVELISKTTSNNCISEHYKISTISYVLGRYENCLKSSVNNSKHKKGLGIKLKKD